MGQKRTGKRQRGKGLDRIKEGTIKCVLTEPAVSRAQGEPVWPCVAVNIQPAEGNKKY